MKTLTIRKINSVLKKELNLCKEDLVNIDKELDRFISIPENAEDLAIEREVIKGEISLLKTLLLKFKEIK